jgi:hypothetical protein
VVPTDQKNFQVFIDKLEKNRATLGTK